MDKKNILILDDDKNLLNMLKKELNDTYNIIIYDSPLKVLKSINMDQIHLIIVDINMPEMDGIQFIKKIHKISPNKKFIVITGYPSIKYNKELLSLGIQYLLEKPFSLDRLKNLIENSFLNNNSIAQINIDMITLLQILKFSNKQTSIIIKSNYGEGIISVKDGFIIECRFNDSVGLTALEEINKLDEYILTEIPFSGQSNTHLIPIDFGILETLRKVDESNNKKKSNMNYKKSNSDEIGLKSIFYKLKDDSNDSIVNAELISLKNKISILQYKTKKDTYSFFTSLTLLINKEINNVLNREIGKYYLIKCVENKIVIIVIVDDYLLGMTVDISKIKLGLFLNIILAKILYEIKNLINKTVKK